MRFLALIIVVFSIDSNGQIGISEVFGNSDFRNGGCSGNYIDDAEFTFYPDSTFLYFQSQCNLDAISNLYSSGTYIIQSDTIKLTSIRNDPNLKLSGSDKNGLIKKHKNGKELLLMDVSFKDLSGQRLFLNKNVLKTDNLIGHFDCFYSENLKIKKSISVKFIIPSNLSPCGNQMELNPDDTYDVYQFVDKYTHRIEVKNDSISLIDIDSTKIIVKSHAYNTKFTTDTITDVHQMYIEPILRYNCNLLHDNHNPCGTPSICAELIDDRFGHPINVKEYLLKTTQISPKKCIRMLFTSSPLNSLRFSYSDSVLLKCQPGDIFELMNALGSKYVNEFYLNYNVSVISVKSKHQADFLISKPAFSNDKIFAFIRLEPFMDKENPKYLLFERRIDNYQLIGELTDKKLKLNGKSIFVHSYP